MAKDELTLTQKVRFCMEDSPLDRDKPLLVWMQVINRFWGHQVDSDGRIALIDAVGLPTVEEVTGTMAEAAKGLPAILPFDPWENRI